jgi:hypothetical protein
VKTLAVLWILSGFAADFPAAAEPDEPEPELLTDRPDQTETAVVVPVGTVQVELGASLAIDDEGGERTETAGAPGTLVRYAFHPRFEMRLEWPGWIEAEGRGASGRSRVSEAADPELGVKVALVAARGARPDMALIAHVSLPAGGEPIGSPRADPSVRLSVAHTLSERVGLGWNAGWEAASFRDFNGDVHTLTRFVYTACLGFDLSARWGAYTEFFGDLPAGDSTPAAHAFDGGFTFLIAPRVQLDVSAGVGLNTQAPDRFVGFGISFRVPR